MGRHQPDVACESSGTMRQRERKVADVGQTVMVANDPAVRQFVQGSAKGPLTVESQVSEGA